MFTHRSRNSSLAVVSLAGISTVSSTSTGDLELSGLAFPFTLDGCTGSSAGKLNLAAVLVAVYIATGFAPCAPVARVEKSSRLGWRRSVCLHFSALAFAWSFSSPSKKAGRTRAERAEENSDAFGFPAQLLSMLFTLLLCFYSNLVCGVREEAESGER
jgi:hypothetical protein